MRAPFVRTLVVFGSAFLFVQPLHAQITEIGNTTSTPVPEFNHDYLGNGNEVVNPANGALSIRIKSPVPHERGTNWPHYLLMYDSNGQYPLTPNWLPNGPTYWMNSLIYAYGAPSAPSAYSNPGIQYTNATYNGYSDPNHTQTFNCTAYSGYTLTDPDGGRHALGLSVGVINNNNSSSCGFFNVPEIYNGGDEEYKATIDPTTLKVSVIDSHGDSPLVEDSNGNLANNSGRSYTATYNGLTTVNTYPGSYGSYTTTSIQKTPTFNLNYTILNNSYCYPGPIKPASGLTIDVVQSITLPNGQQYTFQYDPVYQLVSKITYPSGAWVSYTWSTIPNAEGHAYSAPPPDGSGGG